MSVEPAIPMLPYADAPSRWGISSQLRPGGLRIVIPPIRSWRHLPKAYLGLLFPAFMTAFPLAQMLTSPGSSRSDFLPPIIMHGTITLAIIAHALWRMRQRLVIDVTAAQVAVAVVNPSGRGRRAVWARGGV